MSRRIPLSRRGRLKPTRILRVNNRANRAFNRCLAQELIGDIKRGRTRWPVDTGLSRRSFFYRRLSTGGFDLWNRTEYSKYIEAKERPIQRYWRRNRGKLIQRCQDKMPERDKMKGRRLPRIRSFVAGFARYVGRDRDDD